MTGSAPAAGLRARTGPWYTTLFLVDTLERFGFYGMQAILVLYAAAPAEQGGLGLSAGDAASLFGAWIAVQFMLSLPGGWIGDRMLGQRRTLLLGAATTAVGYAVLAAPVGGWGATAGLIVLAVGGGLYKPNHQALLNLKFGDSAGREAGISLIYVGIQISALLAPLVSGYLGERVDWHLGFAAPALAMVVCAVRVATAAAQLDGVGERPVRELAPVERRRVGRATAMVLGAVLVVLGAMALAGVLSATSAIALAGLLTIVVPVLAFRHLYRNPGLGTGDRRRLRAFLPVFLGATLFWMIIAHAASLLNLFARDNVDRSVMGFEVPASWLQSATPLFILLLAPVVAAYLPRIGGRHNVAVKFGLGLGLAGGSFLFMGVAAAVASDGVLISPLWLLVVYLAHAVGEVVIAAVSISAAAEVLPRTFMARMLGLLWLFAALGGGIGSGVVRLVEVMPEHIYYLGLGGFVAACGLAFWLMRGRLTRALRADDSDEQPGSRPAPARTTTGI